MAQQVGYFEDNVDYAEGPFVIVFINGWRIEVQQDGCKCPVLPDGSIYVLRKKVFGRDWKMSSREEAERVCDYLNSLVSQGEITKVHGVWVWREQA
ncbi:MAG: hypothetical protein DRI48_06015 [Chloroflexi bacterium]|nr:MAG: hypothetical protein DRI48_06015 [Chloroflexota bacterium]